MDKYTLEELKAKIGQKVWYKGGKGTLPPRLAILKNAEFDEGKDGKLVVDVECDNGALLWGYVYQIKFVE